MLLFLQIGLIAARSDANAGIEVDVLAFADHPHVQLHRLEESEDGEFLKQASQQFCTDFCGVGERIFCVFVGDHDVDGKVPHLGFEKILVNFDAELIAYALNRVADHSSNVRAREDVVGVLVVDLVHDRIDDQQGDEGERERNKRHPPSRNSSSATGQHGCFSATAKFGTHQQIAPVAEVLHRPACSRPCIFDANFGMLSIVHKRKECECLGGNGVFKFDAL